MTAATSFNAGTSEQVQSLMATIAQMMDVDIDLSGSAGFKATIESTDGSSVNLRITPFDHGLNIASHGIAAFNLVVPGSGGAADADAAYGSTTLVGSTKNVTVPDPTEGGEAVPADAVLYAIASTIGGNEKSLRCERIDASTIRISSDGPAYMGPLEVDSKKGTNVAGTVTLTLATTVNTTDLLFVEEISTGGTAADHHSAFRAGANTVTVQAHSAAGALQAANTAVVRVHKVPASLNLARNPTTLVAGVGNVTATQSTTDRLFVREVTSHGTVAHHFVAFRVNGTTVRVHAVKADGSLETANTSAVEVYVAGPPDSAVDTLAAGTVTMALASAATDRLSVVQVTAGGTAAVHWSVKRASATTVTVFAHQADGSVQTLNTSVVQVYNHGQSAEETSVVNWLVRRP